LCLIIKERIDHGVGAHTRKGLLPNHPNTGDYQQVLCFWCCYNRNLFV